LKNIIRVLLLVKTMGINKRCYILCRFKGPVSYKGNQKHLISGFLVFLTYFFIFLAQKEYSKAQGECDANPL